MIFELEQFPLNLADGDTQNPGGLFSIPGYLVQHKGHVGGLVFFQAAQGTLGRRRQRLRRIRLEMGGIEGIGIV